jgi:hypothetical protein
MATLIYVEDDQLMVQPEGEPKMRLRYLGNETFGLDFDPTLRLVFEVKDGKVLGGKLTQRGQRMNVFRRQWTIDGAFRARVLAREFLSGFWLNLGSPVTAEMAGLGRLRLGDARPRARAWERDDDPAPAPGSARDPGDLSRAHRRQTSRRGFKRVLDAGAHGVMVPYVSTAARRAPPCRRCATRRAAMRGVAKLTRASAFGARFDEYFAHAHEWLVTLAQIETVDAVENAQEIAEVDGVDVVFVGPMDLTTSMGIPASTATRVPRCARRGGRCGAERGEGGGDPAARSGEPAAGARAGLYRSSRWARTGDRCGGLKQSLVTRG